MYVAANELPVDFVKLNTNCKVNSWTVFQTNRFTKNNWINEFSFQGDCI